jgi:hypothetical protein
LQDSAFCASCVAKQFSGYFPNLYFLSAFGYAIPPVVSVDVFERHTSAISNSSTALHGPISSVAAKSVSPVVAHSYTIGYLHVVCALVHFPSCFPYQGPDHFSFGIQLG